MKRKPLEIKKKIMSILKENQEISVKQLERKINTNYQSILNNLEELEYFGLVKMSKTKENTLNGRDYLIVRLI